MNELLVIHIGDIANFADIAPAYTQAGEFNVLVLWRYCYDIG